MVREESTSESKKRVLEAVMEAVMDITIYNNIRMCFFGNHNYKSSSNNSNVNMLFFIKHGNTDNLLKRIKTNFNIEKKDFCLIGNTDRRVLVLLQNNKYILNRIKEIASSFNACKLENFYEKYIMFSVL
jgi:hypothetical protein